MKQNGFQQIKKKLEWLGHAFFYTVLVVGGQRTAYFFLYPVIFTYVVCSRKIHWVTAPYFKRCFPSHNWLQLRVDVFKNVLSFGKVLVDRGWMGFNRKAELNGTFDDSGRLREAIKAGKGVVILLAHVGNWQTCLSQLEALNVDVHSLMEFDEERVSKHFFELRGEIPFKIINVQGYLGGMIEATAALQKGDIVLMMADRLHQGRHASATFLGSELRLPVAAYHLAAMAESPVIILFAAKTGRKSYALTIPDIFYPGKSGLDKREELQQCAQRFSTALEKYVERYPYQWYNFFDIWSQ